MSGLTLTIPWHPKFLPRLRGLKTRFFATLVHHSLRFLERIGHSFQEVFVIAFR